MKSILVVFMVVVAMVSLMVLTPANVDAAAAFYSCTVDMAGPGRPDTTYIALTDLAGAFTGKWFATSSTASNVQLAVALTAIANGMTVLAEVDTTAGQFPLITSLYLQN